MGRAAVFSEVASHSSNRAKSSRNFCHKRHVSSILTTEKMYDHLVKKNFILQKSSSTQSFYLLFSISDYLLSSYFNLLSIDKAQMLLQRRSRLRVACWMESHSASVAQASQSCKSTSHRFSTDATPVLCFSMSR